MKIPPLVDWDKYIEVFLGLVFILLSYTFFEKKLEGYIRFATLCMVLFLLSLSVSTKT